MNPVAEHETAVEQRQSITHITHRGHHRPRHSHSDANFDWDAIDKQGADVRKANCTGELGSDNFDWASVDAKGADVRSPNMPANIDADAFDKVDLAGADVRKPNCTGQIGDADFNALIKKEQTPLTAAQVSWRLSVLPLAVALPLGLARAALAALPAGWNYTAAVGVGLAGAIVLSKLAKQIVMVKQGTLCFAQFFENGATHVLQAGVQPLASFGTTTQTFEVKEDAMNFGTVTFARVKPGFVGLATDNGKLRLVDSALAPVPSHPPRRLASYAPGRAPSKL